MSTAPAPFPGDQDPFAEALRRVTLTPVSADLAERRAGDRLAAAADLKARNANPQYVAKMQQMARQLFAEAAANTEQPAWSW